MRGYGADAGDDLRDSQPMSKRKSFTYLILLALLVNAAGMLPVLDSPYLGDDSWLESTLRGTVLLSKTSLGEICRRTVIDYVNGGRWYPLMVYYYPVFYYLDQHLYKAFAVILVLVNVLLFGWFVRILTSSRWVGLLSMLLPPLFLQLRIYHDPILAYYYLMQVEFSAILLSLIAFIKYLRTSRVLFMALSLTAFGVCLLTYEAFHAFWIAHFAVALVHFRKADIRRVLKTAGPFFALAVLNVSVTLVIRSLFGPSYEGISLNLSPTAWAATFAKQVFAAIPLTYFLSTDALTHAWEHARMYFFNDLLILCAGWAILWCLTSESAFDAERSESDSAVRSLVLLGICFWLLPAVLISFSGKYQRELKWGIGYLPVYVSSYGTAMLILASVVAAYRAASLLGSVAGRIVMVAFAVTGVVVGGITYNSNRMVVQRYNYVEHYHRALVRDAMRDGLMSAVPEGSFIVSSAPVRSWNTPAFLRMHSGLTLQLVTPAGFPPDEHLGNMRVEEAFSGYKVAGRDGIYDFGAAPRGMDRAAFLGYDVQFRGLDGPIVVRLAGRDAAGSTREAFFVKYEALFRGMGYAVLGRIVAMKADNSDVYAAAANTIRIYVGIPVGYPYRNISITGNRIDRKTLEPTGPFHLTEKELNLISSGPRGKLFEIPSSCMKHDIDPKSILATLSLMDQ